MMKWAIVIILALMGGCRAPNSERHTIEASADVSPFAYKESKFQVMYKMDLTR